MTIMARLNTFLLCSCVLFMGNAHANNSYSNASQALMQQKMQLLTGAQNLMQLEIQSHFKRTQAIQGYQMCLQAARQNNAMQRCKVKLDNEQKLIQEEEKALRKIHHDKNL